MSSTIKAPAMPKPAATGLGDEYEAFDRDGKSMGMAYENVQYFSAAQLAARDAQWQEMVGPVVDAARKLMTMRVGELPHTGYLRDNDISRAALGDLNRALSAITEE